MKILRYKLLIIILIFVSGCNKDSNDEMDAGLTPQSGQHTDKTPIEDKEIKAKPAIAKIKDENDVVKSVTYSVSKLKEGSEIITSAKESLKTFNNKGLNNPIDGDALEYALLEKRDLSVAIKDENSIWCSDPELKKTVIGKFSILVGLIGVPDEATVSDLPHLFINEKNETLNDVLMLQIAKQAVRVADTRVKVSDEKFANWLIMASSEKSITRYTALILFDLVSPTQSQVDTFFKVYSDEKNENISKLLIAKKKFFVEP